MQPLTITIDKQSYPVLALEGRPKALLDCTVAEIYGVETKHINQAVKNNLDKFPPDFYFQLTEVESFEPVKNFDRYNSLKHSNSLPYAFTHLGCNMLATILKSEIAVRRSVEIIRAFTAMESSALTSEPPRDVLQMISAQSRMISDQSKMIAILAEEMYTNRSQIQNHIKSSDQWRKSVEFRLSALEDCPTMLHKPEAISSLQCGTLRNLVKQKARDRKEIARIWSTFKRRFDVTRYVHLPKERFDEACEWIKTYTHENQT